MENNFLELRKTIELHDFVIKSELNNKKSGLIKIFLNDKVHISINAIVWKKENYKTYKKYSSSIELSQEEFLSLGNNKIKKILLCDIFKQVIKNNIMML